MTAADPPRIGAAAREVIGDDELVEIARDGAMRVYRPARARLAIAVLHQRPPDATALLDEADRLAWLGARGPAPAVVAAGRADEGDESIVIRLGVDAGSAALGHPMGPEAFLGEVAGALRELHALDIDGCPFPAGTDELRAVVDERMRRGVIRPATDGPYAGREPGELVALFDRLIAELGPAPAPVLVHGALTPHRVWFDPAGTVIFTGWHLGGVGDRHLDLAAAAAIAVSAYGPALVAPLFDAYGLDAVDLRRLDAHQLLSHLLT